jgi:hypothetical protein
MPLPHPGQTSFMTIADFLSIRKQAGRCARLPPLSPILIVSPAETIFLLVKGEDFGGYSGKSKK